MICSSTQEIHWFSFSCKNPASVEVCFNKESANWQPLCDRCFARELTPEDINSKRWLVKEVGT